MDLQALYQTELEDMCQEEGNLQWEDGLHDEWSATSRADGMICDSTTGKALDMAKVKEGRKEELDYMQKIHVWDRVSRSEAAQDGQGKIVGTRWVYVDRRQGQMPSRGPRVRRKRKTRGTICRHSSTVCNSLPPVQHALEMPWIKFLSESETDGP